MATEAPAGFSYSRKVYVAWCGLGRTEATEI